MKQKEINIIGAGLAGCEIAYQLAKRGLKVKLYEAKTLFKNPVQKLNTFAELVCSIFFRSVSRENAIGILKEELKLLNSFILKTAYDVQVPADDALSVDLELFSQKVTATLIKHSNITIIYDEFIKIDPKQITIIAVGPLMTTNFALELKKLVGKKALYYYDGSTPIVTKAGIDFSKAYYGARHLEQKDYIICPLTEDEFNQLLTELVTAKRVPIADFEKYFRGCQPIEIMAQTSRKILLNKPMSSNNLPDKNGKQPFAVVQLRQDNVIDSLYNIVGWQTNLTWPEQKQIITQFIPGLAKVDIVRYGVLHKNNYINSPKVLNQFLQYKQNNNIFFAGQIIGVEGYLESAAAGLLCALNVY
ncbi:methylenetetrahydrofolate--tRNA-(uracil(54)-C(5))-methyltransferase (FADH(2)-oxidizing) TrmFO [Spiroplasma endosymbiont of Seladonia tumulorum]|uniref:methylenetetrahydrofolate--tRNA-(uracil(54)- C(5))-methyltransferase (FADH(2)-oxidizing) TrmFO n=1 Tax=Spiroplasma endosymbiont of Seladonia tumulorum TaxID=3066321 RepID=UPI0030D275ED